MNKLAVLCMAPLLIFQFSCNQIKQGTLFKEISSKESGIEFSNVLNNSDSFNIIDFLYYYDGGGVALGDINNDGLIDIYFSSNEGKNALYLNKGNLKFEDITESAGVGSEGPWKAGISMTDVNGDGFLDIYVCRLGDYKWVKGHNELYINQGDLSFIEESKKYNLDFSGYSTQAAFFDMDNDGDLDAYLVNHSIHSPNSIGKTELRDDLDSLAGDRLYRNDNNFFTDISEQSGIYRSQVGYGLGIGLTDINQDGYTDIYITNDFLENDYFYINNRDGTFTESFSSMADHTSLSSMGNDLADFNNDGMVDIITLDMLPEDEMVRKRTVGEDPHEIFRMKISFGYLKQYGRNTLQLNRGNGTFSEIGMMAGVHATDWSWAPLFADFNNDGLKDLFVSNGIVRRPNDLGYIEFIEHPDVKNNPAISDQAYLDQMPEGLAHNYFFENNGDLTFEDQSASWGSLKKGITNGIAYGDLDNDGDLDLVLNNLNEKSMIMVNQSEVDSVKHFLNLEIVGLGANTYSIGAKVFVYTENEKQYYEVFPVRGFKSSVDQRISLGLGRNEKVDSIIITWPSGDKLKLFDIKADQFLKVNQSKSYPGGITPIIRHQKFKDINSSQLGVNFRHDENTFIEFNREALIPHMNSQEGPAIAIADINGDGLTDFYIGGAKNQEGAIYVQGEIGFEQLSQPALSADNIAEDVDAAFFDFEKDGDMDLVVVSGGNEFSGEDPNRQPRLYLNDGSGFLKKAHDLFEGVYQNGSVVAVHDFDSDGWDDLFLGSQTVPWNYGISPKSYLLINQGGTNFMDVSHELPGDGVLGIVNDALWADIDGNGEDDLVVAGEWMNVRIMYSVKDKFNDFEIPHSEGWWKTIEVLDYDGDGDLDLLGGNLGLNTKLKATYDEPVRMYVNDFDKNGKLDQLLTYYVDGTENIFSSLKNIAKQIPMLGELGNDGKEFSLLTPSQLIGKELENANILEANEMRSGVFINSNGNFLFSPFPNEMQISWMQDILTSDIDGDGTLEIIAGGNTNASSIQEGWYDADKGNLMRNTPNGYRVVENYISGLFFSGEVRGIKTIQFQGKMYILIARNNNTIQWMVVE